MSNSKEYLLIELSTLLKEPSIKPYIKQIGELRDQLYELTSDIEELNITSSIKAKIQEEAYHVWLEAGRRGAIYIATGVGKTKIAIDHITNSLGFNPINSVIVVPTQQLRDVGWKAEFDKWSTPSDWDSSTTVCYDSLTKIVGEDIHFVVLDEGHNITVANSEFFEQNNVRDIMVLTATAPEKWSDKDFILKRLGVKPVYELSLDEAVELGIAAPYNITIVTMPLDNQQLYVKAGTKANPFYQTEQKRYDWLTRVTFSSTNVMARINRMQFIYQIQSKASNAKKLIDSRIPDTLKTLIFCSNKKQAIHMCDKHYFSRPALVTKDKSKPEKVLDYEYLIDNWHKDEDLKEFRVADSGKLSCVEALNEGENLGKVDVAFVVQLNSKRLHFIQRIGRILRYYRGHIGEIIILAVENTVDMEWVNKAIKGLNVKRIRYVSLEDILLGKETLLINETKQEEAV